MTVVEICIDDVAGARTAEQCGADRVELCAGLVEGGTTPSIGMVAATLAAVHRIGVQVLIRPRGGDFCFSADEVDVMLADIAAIRALPNPAGVPVGFVLNALTAARTIDIGTTTGLLAACGPASTTFSKAVDEVTDQEQALDQLADLGVHRVLTSGGAPTAADGIPALRALVEHPRITVLAAGGVRSPNVAELVRATGVREVHLRAPAPAGSGAGTSADEVAAVVSALA